MSPRTRGALAWTGVAALIAYAAVLYLGFGPAPTSHAPAIWEPTGFLRQGDAFEWLLAHPGWGVALVSAVPIAGAIALAAGGSALALAVGCTGAVTSGLLAFYGLTGAVRVWAFFGWRGTAVIATTGAVAGLALASPALAARWSKLSTSMKLVSYVPIYLFVATLIRDTTGSDERLPINLSPWPAVPVFGLEIAVYTLLGPMIAGAGLAAFLSRSRSRPIGQMAAVVAASGVAVAWFFLRFPHTGPKTALVGFAAALVAAIAIATLGRPTPSMLASRGSALGLAAALVALPLLGARALADGDHAVSRSVRAQSIIDGLARYYERHDAYPDELTELVSTGELASVPAPRVGHAIHRLVGWSDAPRFIYQNLGSSYLLEFASTGWVTCSYSPPWQDIEDDEGDEQDDLRLESWACPAGRPQLW